MATIAAITGRHLPPDTGEDSYDISPLFFDPDLEVPIREATVHHSGNGTFAIRKGRWKLIDGAGSGGWSNPNNARALKEGLPPVQLYQLGDDVKEQRNVEAEYPEVVRELQDLLATYQRNGRSVPAGISSRK
jgi:arylsulfatase A-like enzyme